MNWSNNYDIMQQQMATFMHGEHLFTVENCIDMKRKTLKTRFGKIVLIGGTIWRWGWNGEEERYGACPSILEDIAMGDYYRSLASGKIEGDHNLGTTWTSCKIDGEWKSEDLFNFFGAKEDVVRHSPVFTADGVEVREGTPVWIWRNIPNYPALVKKVICEITLHGAIRCSYTDNSCPRKEKRTRLYSTEEAALKAHPEKAAALEHAWMRAGRRQGERLQLA